jgi:hypothetical protein
MNTGSEKKSGRPVDRNSRGLHAVGSLYVRFMSCESFITFLFDSVLIQLKVKNHVRYCDIHHASEGHVTGKMLCTMRQTYTFVDG